jgi:hypothetical protein
MEAVLGQCAQMYPAGRLPVPGRATLPGTRCERRRLVGWIDHRAQFVGPRAATAQAAAGGNSRPALEGLYPCLTPALRTREC